MAYAIPGSVTTLISKISYPPVISCGERKKVFFFKYEVPYVTDKKAAFLLIDSGMMFLISIVV